MMREQSTDCPTERNASGNLAVCTHADFHNVRQLTRDLNQAPSLIREGCSFFFGVPAHLSLSVLHVPIRINNTSTK